MDLLELGRFLPKPHSLTYRSDSRVLIRDGSEGEVGQQDDGQSLGNEIAHHMWLGSWRTLKAEEGPPLLGDHIAAVAVDSG